MLLRRGYASHPPCQDALPCLFFCCVGASAPTGGRPAQLRLRTCIKRRSANEPRGLALEDNQMRYAFLVIGLIDLCSANAAAPQASAPVPTSGAPPTLGVAARSCAQVPVRPTPVHEAAVDPYARWMHDWLTMSRPRPSPRSLAPVDYEKTSRPLCLRYIAERRVTCQSSASNAVPVR